MKKLQPLILGLALLIAFPAILMAQTTVSISGTVMDSTGAVVPGARVLATNQQNGSHWRIASNGEGFFSFSALPPASYSLRISHQGFENWTVSGIVAHPGDSLTVPHIVLKVGAASTTVVVSAQSAGVTLNSGAHSTLITSSQIKRLSTISRDVSELVSILPGFTLNAGTGLGNTGPGGLYGYQTTSPGSGQLSAFGALGSAPQTAGVSVSSDGAQFVDPGVMAGQMGNINVSQVKEVKVTTADFSAAESKGPVVIDAVGKSGGIKFHGSLYTYVKNTALNSNDWLSNYYGSPRPQFKYFYPGGTIGGPIILPFTHFNRKKKKLVFWLGYEYYDQHQPAGLLTDFIPNASMLQGDLSRDNIARALNVSSAALAAGCPQDYSQTSLFTNVGGFCYTPATATDENGNTVNNGMIPAQDINAGSHALASYWPQANRTPQPVYAGNTETEATDGVNYAKNVEESSNGFQLHTRIDDSISDSLKFYVIYGLEKVNVESPLQNIYYNPPGTIPYPSPFFSNGRTDNMTIDMTKVINSSLTNDFTAAGVYYYQPEQFSDPAKTQTTGNAWGKAGYGGGYLHLNESQLPQISNWDSGVPSLAFGYVPPPPNSQYLRKFDWTIKDNLTKVLKNHTINIGFYMEQTGNSGPQLGSQLNGSMNFNRYASCYIDQTSTTVDPSSGQIVTPPTASMYNSIGNFLIGCPSGYTQAASDPIQNQRYLEYDGFATDQWKVNAKLTLTFGMRFDHLEPWSDPHGIGMAVWEPQQLGVGQHVLYPDTASNLTWPGITWHKRDPSIPNAGSPTRAVFFNPRFGLAYDLFGNGKTVFRGGWGTYYSQDSTAAAGGAEATAIGLQTYIEPQNTGGQGCTFNQLFLRSTYVPCGQYAVTPPASLPPFSIGAMDPKDDDMPVTYNYNLTVDQRGPWNSTFEIAYVGNQSYHLDTLGGLQNQNVIPLGAFFKPDPVTGQLNPTDNIPNVNDYRPYPNYTQVNVMTHRDWSNYNSMQLSWNKQSGSFIYGANYTWSKTLGVRGNYNTGAIADPVDLKNDYGVVSYNRNQVLNVNYSWKESDLYKGNRALRAALNGWEISGITSIQSGPDLSVSTGTNYGMSGSLGYTSGGKSTSVPFGAAEWLGSSDYTLQPIVTCNPALGLKKHQYVNGTCFSLPAEGTQGWYNLPAVYGPAYFTSDLSLFKNFSLGGARTMQFRISGFNFLNHPLYSFNSASLNDLNLIIGECPGCNPTTAAQALQDATISNASTFGYTTAKDGVRIVEMAFEYDF
ncbi:MULTISPECIES: carboxypeptidase-like regulatory domain-containing protein [Acidobacterium]|nr:MULTISPECIES: carboxypeptidase-like regulatory domain-containing protein [Acidobacterium]